MGIDSGAYNAVLLLHILSVIVGFGSLVLNGVYGVTAKALGGSEGLAIADANAKVSRIAEYVVYTVPIWGFGLLGLSDGQWEFGQTWVWLSFVLYVIALGLAHAVLIPTDRRMRDLMRELVAGPPPAGGPPPQAAELDALGKRIGGVGMLLNVMLVVILVLMIWKPGA